MHSPYLAYLRFGGREQFEGQTTNKSKEKESLELVIALGRIYPSAVRSLRCLSPETSLQVFYDIALGRDDMPCKLE